jgi:translation initiation factor 2 subunit 1
LKYPEVDTLVIGIVKKIFDYGAICYLEEYDVDAFVHISEVSKGWVKNIRSFLKEGQQIVAKVQRVVPEKGIVDISIKRVSESERNNKLNELSRNKRGEKLLEKAFPDMKKEEFEKLKNEIKENYGDLYTIFEEAIAGKKLKIPENLEKKIIEVAKENIKLKEREIDVVLKLECYENEGVEIIKEILSSIKEEIIYLGAPKYMIKIKGDNYKKCEKKLKDIQSLLDQKVNKFNCFYSIERMES